VSDACLINRYDPGARPKLHQDKNERDFDQPIVSVSLGLSATFLFGGLKSADTAVRVKLTHGDVVVWGRPARLRYHGVLALKEGHHALVGGYRINLTFRQAACAESGSADFERETFKGECTDSLSPQFEPVQRACAE
jgi:alkylated DNA repair protein (DNA oxidative demethylase)